MKVIFFCLYLFARDGTHTGRTVLLMQFIPELITQGIDVEVVSLAGVQNENAPCKVTILQSIDHNSEWSKLLKVLFWVKIILALVFYVGRNYRRIEACRIVTLTAGASLVLPFFYRKVLIWENVAYLAKRQFIDLIRLRIMSLCKSIIVVPTGSEQESLLQLPFTIDVRYIHNWHSPHVKRREPHDKTGARTFMSAGHFQTRKGFDLLINAVSTIVDRLPAGTQFHIFGDGVESKFLTAMVSDYGLENYILFPGTRDGLSDVYHHFDVFILPSRLEGFPIVMLDSLAAGLPLVAFDCPTGPGQILSSGYNGILVENGSISGLASAILHMLETDQLAEYGQGAIASVAPYQLSEIVDEWMKIIQSN